MPGCSTGQEAYSLAIVISEYLEATHRAPLPVQIFATDLSDAMSLQQARQGLYPGSIEAEVSAGGRIELHLEREGEHALVRVRDNGIGITEAQLSRIFDMFAQADNSLERTRSGLGIGLTLVRTLVEMHGGEVAAHSAGAGRGSEFVVRLPILAEAQMAQPEPPECPGRGAITAQARRILVVDDNQICRTPLGGRDRWVQVTAVADG